MNNKQICPQNNKNRCELHMHTVMTHMGSLIQPEDAVKFASEYGFSAIAVTDTGDCAAYPQMALASGQYGQKVIYGVEAVLSEADHNKNYGIVLLARDKVGLKNLYQLVSGGMLMDHYPQAIMIERSELNALRTGLLVGSSCNNGELMEAISVNATEERLADILNYYDYFEVQPIYGYSSSEEEADKIKLSIKKIISAAERFKKPVAAVDDARFLRPNDKLGLKIIAGIGSPNQDNNVQDERKFLHTTGEMLAEFQWLGAEVAEQIVVINTKLIADSIRTINPIPEVKNATYSFTHDTPYEHKNEPEKFKQFCIDAAKALYGSELPEPVVTRLEFEWNKTKEMGVLSAFEALHLFVRLAAEYGSSVTTQSDTAVSFLAYLIGANDINPLPPHYRCDACLYSDFQMKEHPNIMYGVELPDAMCPICNKKMHGDGYHLSFERFSARAVFLDLRVDPVVQYKIKELTQKLFGEGRVLTVGKEVLVKRDQAKKYIEKYLYAHSLTVSEEEQNRLIDLCTGVKRTNFQHPACFLVVPDGYEVYDICPVSVLNDATCVAQFQYKDVKHCFLRMNEIGHVFLSRRRLLEKYTKIRYRDIPVNEKVVLRSLGYNDFGSILKAFSDEDVSPASAWHAINKVKMQWYKLYYPLEYYCATLTNTLDKFPASDWIFRGEKAIRRKINTLIRKAETAGISKWSYEWHQIWCLSTIEDVMASGLSFLPVNLNVSDETEYLPENGKIRLPLCSQKGVYERAAVTIAESRKTGDFKSYDDLMYRTKLPKTTIDILIKNNTLEKAMKEKGGKMKVKLHRPQNTIGGNIIEITSKKAGILLDCGCELEDSEDSGKTMLNELFSGESPDIDAVFLTHYHKDHIGLLEYIPEDTAVYIGSGAERVWRIIIGKSNAPFSDDIVSAGHLYDRQPIRVKDITVTPFLCDHSAYDSYMLLVESDGESILYTGDFRSNGRKSFKALLAKIPSKVNTLICEGTNINRGAQSNTTEAELEKQVIDILADLPREASVFVLQSLSNIDRIVTMYRAATASGRIFLEDTRTAEVTSAIRKSIPNPNNFGNVYAFITNGSEENHRMLESFTHRAGKDFIATHPFVMCVRSSMLNYLKKLSEKISLQNGVLLYSMWNGYKSKPEMKEFLDGCRALGLRIINCHCSGHADADAITQLVERGNPDRIIPVHTEDAEAFGRFCRDIIIEPMPLAVIKNK